MKYANSFEMLKQHYNDIVETLDPPSYQDGALYAMSLVVHIMLVCHAGDKKKVIEDIGTIATHAAESVEAGLVQEQNRKLH
jgi:hypothetical protein